MSLLSLYFIGLFPIITLINFIIPKAYRKFWLLLASIGLYLSGGVKAGVVLVVCILSTYLAARFIDSKDGTTNRSAGSASDDEQQRSAGSTPKVTPKTRSIRNRIIFILTVLLNIGLIVMARKFVSFGIVGISFFTLQAISYVADVYGGKIQSEKNVIEYALFVSMFPTVTSGPITRAGVVLPQIKSGCDFDYAKARKGFAMILGGFLMKLAIADRIKVMVDTAFSQYESLAGAAVLFGVMLYGIQLYCDFAGYSLIAIGAAKILGFEVGDNFRQPYLSESIGDFWNRWHISLSSWLKDYVYIPLGGNRRGVGRKCFNLFVTFAISGIWHGAGLSYLCWGLIHGFYQVVVALVGKRPKRGPIGRICGIIGTFLLVDIAWLPFRAESMTQVIGILRRVFTAFNIKEMTYYGQYMLGIDVPGAICLALALAILLITDIMHEKGKYIFDILNRRNLTPVRWLLYLVLVMVVIGISVKYCETSGANFIYAGF